MKYEHAHWGWMLAADFFLGGTGGGLLIAAAVLDLVLGQPVQFLAMGLAAAVMIGGGSGLLLLELGRPLQGWRVFLNPRAILTIGALLMLLALGCAVAYASFGLPFLPWSGLVLLRQVVAAGGLVSGVGIATYTGILLGRMKGRGLWSGPALVGLFLLSALSTGMSALALIDAVSGVTVATELTTAPLAIVLGLQLVLWPVFLYVKASSGSVYEVGPAVRWISGDRAVAFWGGVWALGLALPLALLLAGGPAATVLAPVAVLAGGLIMRMQVVTSNDRTWLPGEQAFAAALPRSDDPVFQLWSKP